MLAATDTIANFFSNITLNIVKSDVNWFLSVGNNYLQELSIKISERLAAEAYSKLKMTDMIMDIKCWLLLKVIRNYRFLQPFYSEEYKSKRVLILSVMANFLCFIADSS